MTKVLTEADAVADLAGLPRPVSHYTDQVMQVVNDVPMDAVRTQWGVDACEMLRELVSERDALAGRVAELEAAALAYNSVLEALRVAWTYAANPIDHCKKSPSSSGWMVERASDDETLIRDALATHIPARAALSATTPEKQAMSDLTKLAQLAVQHSLNYASPHYFVLSVAGLRSIIEAAQAAQPEAAGWRALAEETHARLLKAQIFDLATKWSAMLASAPTPEPISAPTAEPVLSFNCTNGCGSCGVKLVDFVTHATQAQDGDPWVTMASEPQVVSTCCGSPVEVWDERKQDIVASVATPPSAATEPSDAIDIDWLSNVIRKADGNNTLGAGALAEKIVAAIHATKGGKL